MVLEMDEQALVKLYAELTGETDAAARDVFMMLCEQDGPDRAPRNLSPVNGANGEPYRRIAPEQELEKPLPCD
jgi:hypothetical protein